MGKNVAPARLVAWTVLRQVAAAAKDTPLPVLLARESERHGLDARDAGLATELVYGVLRSRARLEFLTREMVKKPGKLPQDLYLLVLMGGYELLFLEQIPARATIHQLVELARKGFGERMGGLTNAVLRAVDRQAEELQQVDALFCAWPPENLGAEDVARRGSLPLWLAQQWLETYGADDAWSMAANAASRPEAFWRLNCRRPGWENARAQLESLGAMWVEETALCLGKNEREESAPQGSQAKGGSLLDGLERDGFISRQGLGSIRVVGMLTEAMKKAGLAGSELWDACCGRGGKSCALLERGVNVGLCSDPVGFRLEALEASVRRLGLPRPEVLQGTVQSMVDELTQAKRWFPVILVDAPCSGSGTVGRNPELRLRLTPQRVAEAARVQRELLEQAWTVLQPGGLLAYCTCSVEQVENEAQIKGFTAAHSAAEVLHAELIQPWFPGQDYLFFSVMRKAG